MRPRPRPLRPSATGLPDAVVAYIVTEVVRQRGYFDLDLVLVWLCAERQSRGRLLHFPLRQARELAPTGTAG
jgi:hypothetical protein